MSAPNRDWWTQSQPNPAVVPPAQQQAPGSNNMLPYKWPIQSANTGLGPRQPPIPTDWPWGRNGAVQPPEPPVIPDTLYITSASPLPTATVGVPYSFVFQAANGEPPYRFSGFGNLVPPAGGWPSSFGWWMVNTTPQVQFGRQPGEMYGTPQGVSRSFDVTVTDNAGATFTKTFSLPTVPGAPLAITTAALPDGEVGQIWNLPQSNLLMQVTGGTEVYGNWSATGLPSGMGFSSGYLSGVPGEAGTFNPTFTVQDNSGATASRTLSLTINPSQAQPLSMAGVPEPLPDGYYPDQPYYFDLSPYSSGGTPPYAWGTWGTGWDMTDPSGVIGGTPSWAGTMSITIQLTDSDGGSVQEDRTITIIDTSQPQYHRMYDGKKE